jgi:hypothetical protein
MVAFQIVMARLVRATCPHAQYRYRSRDKSEMTIAVMIFTRRLRSIKARAAATAPPREFPDYFRRVPFFDPANRLFPRPIFLASEERVCA